MNLISVARRGRVVGEQDEERKYSGSFSNKWSMSKNAGEAYTDQRWRKKILGRSPASTLIARLSG